MLPEIGAYHLSLRMAVCNIDGPDSSAGSDIENSLRVSEGGSIQVSLQKHEHDFMVDIQSSQCSISAGRTGERFSRTGFALAVCWVSTRLL
jgi:hypothetical protein